jgi:hypothetical protein
LDPTFSSLPCFFLSAMVFSVWETMSVYVVVSTTNKAFDCFSP